MKLNWMDIFVIVFINFAINYFVNYLKEKSKNWATKEDISEITKLIEDVKATFMSQNEKLKMQLSIIGNTQISILHDQRKAIINFTASYISWFNLMVFSPPDLVTDHTISTIDEYREKLDRKLNDMLIKEMVFDIYVDCQELIELKNALKIISLDKYKTIIDEFLVKAVELIVFHETMMQTYDPQTQLMKKSELSQKLCQLYQLMNQSKNQTNAEIAKQRHLYYDGCKKVLYGRYGKEMGSKKDETKEDISL